MGPAWEIHLSDVSHELKTRETPSHRVEVDMSPEHRLETWRPNFTGAALERNPGTAAAWKEFEQQTKLAAGQSANRFLRNLQVIH